MQYAVASSAAMKSPMASRPPLLCSLHRMYHRLAIEAFLDYSAGADGYTPGKTGNYAEACKCADGTPD